MEMPKGLMIILALLSLGMCWDVAIIANGGEGMWIVIVLLVGRLAAIGGILKRDRLGWFLAMGFFVVILALNALAASMPEAGVSPLQIAIPVVCLIYLFATRTEFG